MEDDVRLLGARYSFNLTDELNDAANAALPVREGRPDNDTWFATYYTERLAAFETFAERLTRELKAFSPQLTVTAASEDAGESGAIVMRFGGKEYRAEDKRPDEREPIASTHQRNAAFMLSARAAVDALIADLTEKHPKLAETAASQRAGLSERCSVRCHEFLRRAGRLELAQEAARRRQNPRSALD